MLARHKEIRFTAGANEYLSTDDACHYRVFPDIVVGSDELS